MTFAIYLPPSILHIANMRKPEHKCMIVFLHLETLTHQVLPDQVKLYIQVHIMISTD